MAIITIKYSVQNNFVREPLIQELYWYDNLKKEIIKFEGTKLEFEYKEDPYILSMNDSEKKEKGIKTTYRVLPKPVLVDVINYNKKESKNNKKDVVKFFKDYLNYNNTDISINSESVDSISFNVKSEEVDDFIYQIERNGYQYDLY